MDLLLHNYRRCPYCIRVRMVIALKGIPCRLFEEKLRDWSPWMQQWAQTQGQKSRVPVLRDVDSDFVLPESHAINLWLDRQFSSSQPLAPEEGSSDWSRMQSLWEWCDGPLVRAITLYKYGKDRQFDPQENIEHTAVLKETLQVLEQALEKPYLLGENLSLADIAILPFVRQIQRVREGEFSWEDLPNTRQWAEQILQAAWFEPVMAKH